MYGKIFAEIYDSTLMDDGSWMAVYVFMSMVVLADKDGIVNYTERSLFRKIGLDREQFDEFLGALKVLESEDEFSNLPDEKGRRIVPLSEITRGQRNRGWQIVNYLHYCRLGNKDEARRRDRERKRKKRQEEKSQ